jgi:4-alpha-glucanotransferase
MILLVQQKNGEIQFNESLQQLMNSLLADSQTTNWEDSEGISRDLRVQWRADSSGNWELRLLANTDSRLFRTAPSLQ